MSATTTTVLARVLKNRRLSFSIWLGSVVAVCGLYAGLYPSMEKVDLEGMLKALPPALVEALGYEDMATAAGYLGSAIYGLVAFFLLMVFAIMTGASLLAGEEQDGALELELTSPVARSTIYFQRLLALWAELAVLTGAVLVALVLIDLAAGLNVNTADLLVATVQLWLVLTLFGTLAFSAGAATGRRAVSLGAAVGTMVVSWMLNALGPMLGYAWMAQVSPVGWYMDDNPVTRGFQAVDTLLLAGVTVALVVLGWRLFERRDLMTS